MSEQKHTPEPFGYFRAEPFGWTDCSETDEGAVPLYEQAVVTNLQQQLAHMTDDAAGLRVLLREAKQQRDDPLSVLEDIAKITYDAGFNIGGPLEHCPGNLPKVEPNEEKGGAA